MGGDKTCALNVGVDVDVDLLKSKKLQQRKDGWTWNRVLLPLRWMG